MNTKSILTFGPLNKKLLIPFLLALNQILYNIFISYYPGKTNQILESYSTSIGHMLILIIPRIKFFAKSELTTKKIFDDQKTCSKKSFCHYFILIFLYNIETLLLFGASILERNSPKQSDYVKLPHATGPFTKESFVVVFIAIVAYFLLKYKYYIHNIISLIAFIIMGIFIDIILEKFQEEFSGRSSTIIAIYFFELIVEVLNFCYQKYMIDILFHYFYNVVFALGLDLFICNTIGILFYFSSEELKASLLDSFDDWGLLIPRFIINMIFQFSYFLLRILTLVYFTPTHLLICLSLSKFIAVLINHDDSIKYLSIIPFLFQFFSLMIYLEIIELNFCGLNKNTKRNIQKRVQEEMLNQERPSNLDDDKVEFSEGYYLNNRLTRMETFNTRDTSRKTGDTMIELRASPDWQDKVLNEKI